MLRNSLSLFFLGLLRVHKISAVRYDHIRSEQLLMVLTEPHEQTAYLVALTSLVKAVPKATYSHEMKSVSCYHSS
jgi:hypothetical protein